MWVQVKTAPNLMIAETWKELFEGEGIPTRLLADDSQPGVGEFATYRILVDQEKAHVIDEILRKL
ncbi:MAG: hypothetical protein HYY32_02410 [Chloroflexi bacterium]|nr:hypothetical protein [Chloroflexota bacterium]